MQPNSVIAKHTRIKRSHMSRYAGMITPWEIQKNASITWPRWRLPSLWIKGPTYKTFSVDTRWIPVNISNYLFYRW